MDFSYFSILIEEFRRPLKDPVLVFALILSIILFSPLVLKKFRIPGIIGLIISGIVFGPHGLNLLEKNSAVELFSTIGLLYIMFIAGLELDMMEFRKSKYKSMVFGFLAFFIPFSMGYPMSFYLLGYNMNASLLVAILFATHTMVAYPIISKYGLSKNEAVTVTIGGTILTDTAVLVILAIILSSSQGRLNAALWIRLGISLVFFLFVLFWLIPRIARWFLTKLESEKTSHYIFILSVVFFAAFVAKVCGLDPIIGAFAAGISLNKLIPHTSSLMNRIEFIGNSIFIPFFLISVGMIINMKVFFTDSHALIIALLLTAAALSSKWLAAFITSVIFKYNSLQRQLIFGLSSSHAAAILAVALVGYNYHIVDETILNSTIIIILITCIVASFVTDRSSQKILLLQKVQSDSPLKSFHKNYVNILIPMANFTHLEMLFDFASLIKNKNSSNPITILSVVPNDREAEAKYQTVKTNLDAIARITSSNDFQVNVIATIDHNIASGIIRTSKEISADLLLLGWPQKTNIVDKFIGEKTENIIHDCYKTLFICHIDKPIISAKRIFLMVPRFAELEEGFQLWLNKLVKLSQELTSEIHCYCNRKTRISMENHLSNSDGSTIFYNYFDALDDFLVISRKISEIDLVIFVSARKGSVSYQPFMDNLALKLEKYFNANLKILIYPQQSENDSLYNEYSDVSGDPISQGIKTIQKVGKEIGGIIKK